MTKVHIKFLDHGKGDPAKASSYLLDKLDHLGNVRAGIEVLRGDATTFNAICNSSPHLWKYTSGVIAWSKDDAPTDEQIKEVLNEFEKHAFAGLEQSQYHLFAVLHTDDDGSKHIHVLTPRIDLESGKSLNIAPPGHEKHFDSLRDYFNTKYQWSRPDDLLLMQTTQEPNHIAKLNKQAKNILSSQDFEGITRKQFHKVIDNYVRTLLKTQTVKNRADIIDCIQNLDAVHSIKQSKGFLAVTLKNNLEKTYRLKGDFYHEQFEIGSYTKHLRAAAESRPTANELAAALTDADRLRATYRAKREAYNQQHYAFTASTADDNSPRITNKLDFDRDRESITPSNKNANSELYGANRATSRKTSEYKYCGHRESEIEHRFVFNLTSRPPNEHKPPVAGHQDRPVKPTEINSKASRAGNREPNRADREPDQREASEPVKTALSVGDAGLLSATAFNDFLSTLSAQFKQKDNRSSKSTHSTNLYEVSHADRDRPIFSRAKRIIESTKQLVSGAKQLIESTNQFIKEHFDRLSRSRAELKNPTQTTASLDFSTQSRVIENRTGQFFAGFTASISRKLEDAITDAINQSIKSTGFKQHCQQFSEDRIKTHSDDRRYTAGGHRESPLENLAIQCTEQLLRRHRDAKQAAQYAGANCRQIDRFNRRLEQLETTAAEIRLKPKPATHFGYLRNDAYYPDYVIHHKNLSDKQQEAFASKKPLQLIDYIKEKSENLQNYLNRASKNLSNSDYQKIGEIIKNDEKMLKYLKCEMILEPQNDHLEKQRDTYQTCLKNFDTIKLNIKEITNPTRQKHVSQQTYEPEYKPKPSNDNDFKM